MQDQWPAGRRKGFDGVVGDSGRDCRRGDLLDLFAIDEAHPVVVRLHRDAVEEVQLGDLEHVFDLPEFGPRSGQDRSADFERLVGNGPSLIHRYLL